MTEKSVEDNLLNNLMLLTITTSIFTSNIILRERVGIDFLEETVSIDRRPFYIPENSLEFPFTTRDIQEIIQAIHRIPKDILDAANERITRAFTQYTEAIKSPIGLFELNREREIAQFTICRTLDLIRWHNEGKLPNKNLEILWKSFVCGESLFKKLEESCAAALRKLDDSQWPKIPWIEFHEFHEFHILFMTIKHKLRYKDLLDEWKNIEPSEIKVYEAYIDYDELESEYKQGGMEYSKEFRDKAKPIIKGWREYYTTRM